MDDKSHHFAEQMPQTIGRYQVQGSIGYGAMGAVYKAFDPLIKRTLAIKTIRLDIPRQSPQYKSFIERFYHEARISGTLSHPNIVTLFDIGEENGIPYLAMEFVEGETISAMLEGGVRFNPEKVIALVSQIASAIDYAHGRGVIHRDIKPSNLILFENERVKVTDFGIAKLVDAEMTQSGTLLGTPSYMSPEQAMGDKLDGRSDIFSLGVCAFEMLSGDQPFPGNNVTSILYKLVHVDPVEPANLEMNGLVPQKWHEVFGKVLSKKPDDRYQTASEFVQDLEYCLGSWFGSAVGDDVLAAEAAPAEKPAPAPPPPPPAVVDNEATTALPAMELPPPAPPAPVVPPPAPVPAPAPAAVAPPPPPPPPPAPVEDELPATVHMKAPTFEPPGKTVMMTADQLPPMPPPKPAAPPPPPPAPAPSAPPPPATILMPSPVSAPEKAAKAALVEDMTVRTPRKEVPEATIRQMPDQTVQVPAAKPAAPAPKAPRAKPPKPPAAPKPVAAAPKTPPPAPPPTVTAPAPVPEATTRAPQQSSGIPAALILGGAGLVFVLALVVAGVLLLRHRNTAQATPEPPPPVLASTAPTPVAPTTTLAAAPATGTLHVESQPPGAAVTVNGEAKGVTPLDIPELPLASYEVKLELKGYDSKTQSIALTAEVPKADVSAALTRPVPTMGVADILSTPFGATVTVDGKRVGQTPMTDYRIRPGSHQVQFEKEGYEPQTAMLVAEAGKRAKVDGQLKAIVKATPTPVADVVDPNKIYVNSGSDVETLARKKSGPAASYPDSAPRLKSGDAVSASVSFVVTEAGDVTDMKVVESGGKAVDDAVMGAIRNWKYEPAVKHGVKVKVKITFKQTFRAG